DIDVVSGLQENVAPGADIRIYVDVPDVRDHRNRKEQVGRHRARRCGRLVPSRDNPQIIRATAEYAGIHVDIVVCHQQQRVGAACLSEIRRASYDSDISRTSRGAVARGNDNVVQAQAVVDGPQTTARTTPLEAGFIVTQGREDGRETS